MLNYLPFFLDLFSAKTYIYGVQVTIILYNSSFCFIDENIKVYLILISKMKTFPVIDQMELCNENI
ncbi:MAG: hypothetical protein COB98_02270 [Flavobacteriaceae bacterium]|nr:MAG: hypothetical protein COB98_02270 [Flavobacteriaceae bacterium]